MNKKTNDVSRSASRNLREVADKVITLIGRVSGKIALLCTWRGLAFCALGAHLLLSACAGGGGGSSHSGSPSSPPAPPPDEEDPAPVPPPPPPGGAPLGELSILLGSSVGSNLAPVEETHLRFGGAFGAGPDLGRVLAVDSLARSYSLDLRDRTRSAGPSLDLLEWLAPSNQQFSLANRAAPGIGLGLNFSARTRPAPLASGQYEDDIIAGGFALIADFSRARVSLSRDWPLERHFGLNAEARAENYNLMGISAFASPYLSLTGPNHGVVVAQEMGEDAFSLRLGFGTERLPDSDDPGGETEVFVGEVIRRLSNGSWIGLQLGSTLEGNRLLGSQGSGAFELPPTSTTLFKGLTGRLHVNDSLEVFGQASLGFTDPVGSAQGLLRDVSTLTSSSFGFGIAPQEVLTPNDRLTLGLSQPLRVEAATAIFDRAVGWRVDGRILRQRDRISLEPEGREIDIEVGYLFPLRRNVNMRLNWLGQLEPGHNRDASPEHTLALKLRAEF